MDLHKILEIKQESELEKWKLNLRKSLICMRNRIILYLHLKTKSLLQRNLQDGISIDQICINTYIDTLF